MESQAVKKYHRFELNWALILIAAILLFVTSFFLPSRLTNYPLSFILTDLKGGGLFHHISIYSLFLIPIIVGLVAFNKIKSANLLTSLYIVCQLDTSVSLRRLLFLEVEPFFYFWFIIGGLVYGLLYKEIIGSYLKKWAMILLIIVAILFTGANLFIALIPAINFRIAGIFTIFSWTLILLSASRRLPAKAFWPSFAVIATFSFYMMINEFNCNIEFIGDMGIVNNNPLHILNVCSTYLLWLTVGFVIPVSIRQKIK